MANVDDGDSGGDSGGESAGGGVDSSGSGVGSGGPLESLRVVGQEIRRSSANAVAVDFLYVFATAFFATLAVRGLWPALIAALPIVVLLAFAWMSSRLFFLTNVLVVVLTVAVTRAGLLPL